MSGCVQTVGDDSQEVYARSKFSYKTLVLCLWRRKIHGYRSARLSN